MDELNLGRLVPTSAQCELFAAATLPGEQAANAWEAWSRANRIDDVDAATRHLLPWVYRNLIRQGVADASLGRLKGLHRYNWSHNQLALRRLSSCVELLRDAGINVSLSGGVAISLTHAPDLGARLIDDSVVRVEVGQALDAFATLSGAGFAAPIRLRRAHVERLTSLRFCDREGNPIILAWGLPWKPTDTADGFAVEFASMVVQVSAASTELMRIVLDGMWSNRTPGLRWLTDLSAVLRGPHADGIDWEKVQRTARQGRFGGLLATALRVLRDTCPVIDVSKAAAVMTPGLGTSEARELWYRAGNSHWGVTPNVAQCWFEARRRAGYRALPAFGTAVATSWGSSSLIGAALQVPRRLLTVSRRLR